jgi:hypothetical protein
MNSNLRQISNNEALRISIKAKQIDSSDTSFLKSILKDKIISTSKELLKVNFGNELANLNHMGFYLIKNSLEQESLLIPLHDESFLIVENYSDSGSNMRLCSDFKLVIGYSALSTI